MDISIIEQVLIDQAEELEGLRKESFISRPEEKLINLNSKLAQVVIGVRRSGKSTLCFNVLEKAKAKYAYVNFDDERFKDLSTDNLNTLLTLLYRIYGDFDYLFLDEIQNVDGWPLFVNRLLRQHIHLLITGSNAKLLSNELSSHLTGRHIAIELFPFSFAEWCEAKDIKTTNLSTRNRGLLCRAFDQYLHIGGFPELINESSNRTYVNTLYKNIITQDIQRRFKIKNITELNKLADHILNEVPDCFNTEVLKEISSIKDSHTILKYLSLLRQTYLISAISKYSTKSRQRSTGEKYYAIDVSLMDKRDNAFAGENLGWRLETIVYLELRRRYTADLYDIYYVRERGWETDFAVCKGNKTVALYQVSYDISNNKTLKREINGCLHGAEKTHCNNIYLITNNEKGEITKEGITIKIIPAFEWLTYKTFT